MEYGPRERIAAEVRAELARRKMTPPDLARETGISLTTLRRRLSGASAFDLDELTAITEHFGVTVTALVARADQEIAS